MAGNTFGKQYKITTFGESHGDALGVIIDGCPAGFELDIKKIQKELDRRKPGQSEVSSLRKEDDKVEIFSGLYKGKTTGTPIMMMIKNNNIDEESYKNLKNTFRPDHADYTYHKKYGIRDHRGSGRASGRETVARVMGGAVAKQILEKFAKIHIQAYIVNVVGTEAKERDLAYAEKNDMRCPDKNIYKEMKDKVINAKKENESLGGAVEINIQNVPPGIGEPVFDKLDAELAKAFMGIGSVKGVSFGLGRDTENMTGSEYQDIIVAKNNKIVYETNNAGGIIGGISTGENIIARLVVKPTPTRAGITMNLPTEDYKMKNVKIQGRHDPTIMPRLAPVAEAMAAITVLDYIIQQKGYEAISSKIRK